jgi:hypothetical protein
MPAFLLSLALLFAPANARSRAGDAAPAADYEAALATLLQRVVTDQGLVRYDLLRGELNASFRSVLKAVEDYDVSRLRTEPQKLAFWMNAYNVQMLQNIIETPQVRNILNDGYGDKFFKTAFRTARMDLTLDEIENVVLRRQSGRAALNTLKVAALDPRIHVGLNCAATSCPRLRKRAFTAANLNAELDAAMRDFANSSTHLRADGSQRVLSSLLDWFGADFDSRGKAGDFLLGYMNTSRPGYTTLKTLLQGRTAAQIKAQPGVRYEYLWTVNRGS